MRINLSELSARRAYLFNLYPAINSLMLHSGIDLPNFLLLTAFPGVGEIVRGVGKAHSSEFFLVKSWYIFSSRVPKNELRNYTQELLCFISRKAVSSNEKMERDISDVAPILNHKCSFHYFAFSKSALEGLNTLVYEL